MIAPLSIKEKDNFMKLYLDSDGEWTDPITSSANFINFSATSWAKIKEAAQQIVGGTYPFSTGGLIGCTRTIDLGATYGKVDWVVVDVNHEYNGKRYGFVFMPKTYTLLPMSKQAETNTPDLNYAKGATIQTYLTNVYNAFPAEVKALIKPVTIEYNSQAVTGNTAYDPTMNSTLDTKLFLPSLTEVGFPADSYDGKYWYKREGTPFPYFTSDATRIRKTPKDGTVQNWWTRSLYNWYSYTYSVYVTTAGAISYAYINTEYYICPVFCI